MRDVLDEYRIASNGMGAHLASLDYGEIPHHIWQGLQHYAHAVAKVKEHADFLEDQDK